MKVLQIIFEVFAMFCVAIILFVALQIISGNAEYEINCKFCDTNWTNINYEEKGK